MNSMTGFGAATALLAGKQLRVEISGINRKQVEIGIFISRDWVALEPRIREFITPMISRGRITIHISPQEPDSKKCPFFLNAEKLHALSQQLSTVSRELGTEVTPTLDGLVRLGILTDSAETTTTVDEAWEALQPALREAMTHFCQMRAREGAHLCEELLSRVQTLRHLREAMLQEAGGTVANYRKTMLTRLAKSGINVPMDDERLLKEIALFADRCDVSEELSRLSSHFDQFEQYCTSGDPVGRTLDFLCQEIFRELNTTGTKANSAALTQLVVTAKTELEKIREQVQNVE